MSSDVKVAAGSPPLVQGPQSIAMTPHRPTALLISIGLLYVSFGSVFGIIQSGLPPILRMRGVDVGSLGWLASVLLPFGLTFLWAPFVDRWPLIRRAPLISWIVLSQLLSVGLILIIAFVGLKGMTQLFILVLGLVLMVATMDIALDALASKSVPVNFRSIAAGIKVGALAFGSILGGGLFVLLYAKLGWETLFLLLAAFTSVATLPILFQTSWDRSMSGYIKRRKVSLLGPLRNQQHRRRLGILAAMTVPLVLLVGMGRVMLVDAGITLDQIGAVVGVFAPVASLIVTAGAVLFTKHFGVKTSIFIITFLALAAVGLILMSLSGHWKAETGAAGVVLATGAASGFYVILSTAILGWANTDQPATDYAAYYGLSRLGALIVLVGASQLIPLTGWINFYVIGALGLIVAVIFLFQSGELRTTPERGRGNLL